MNATYVNEKYDSKQNGAGFYTIPAVAFDGFCIQCPVRGFEAEAHRVGHFPSEQFLLIIHLGKDKYDPFLNSNGSYLIFNSLDDVKEALLASKYGRKKLIVST
jgi:hypothetical protein